MLFSNILIPAEIADVFINNIRIDYVSSTRFLGVIIDDKLKFNLHIKEISKKISKNVGVLHKLKEYVPQYTLLSVYRSIIECHINYCNILFGNACDTHLSPLVVAQKKAVRIVANQPPLSHSDPIFQHYGLLKVSDFYKYNLGIYMWKNLDLFRHIFRINSHNTRSGQYYEPPIQRLTLTFKQSIMNQAPINWLDIPDFIKLSPTLKSFKRNYKSFILLQHQ